MQVVNIILGMVAALVFTVMGFMTVGLFGLGQEELMRMDLLDHGREILSMNKFQWRLVFVMVVIVVGFVGFIVGKAGFKLVVAGLLLALAAFVYFQFAVEQQLTVDVRGVQTSRFILIAGAVVAAILLLTKLGLQAIVDGNVDRQFDQEAEK